MSIESKAFAIDTMTKNELSIAQNGARAVTKTDLKNPKQLCSRAIQPINNRGNVPIATAVSLWDTVYFGRFFISWLTLQLYVITEFTR